MTTLQSSITQAISTLQSTLVPELSVLSGSTSNLSTQIEAQLTGGSPGSLANVMTSLTDAASAGTSDGSVPSASLPLLFQAMNNSISAAYSSVSVDDYYFVTGQAYDSSGTITANTADNTTSSFNLATVQGLQNTAFSTAATSLFSAEVNLDNTVGISTGSPITTGATVSTEATQAVGTLAQSIVSSLTSTTASGNTGAIEALLNGSATGSLASQLTSLLSEASSNSDGSVPSTSLPLLYTAVDDAIEASYNTTAVSSFLLAVSPVYLPGGTGTTSSSTSGSSSSGSGSNSSGSGSTTGTGSTTSSGSTTTDQRGRHDG